jgi:hypothetical protein
MNFPNMNNNFMGFQMNMFNQQRMRGNNINNMNNCGQNLPFQSPNMMSNINLNRQNFNNNQINFVNNNNFGNNFPQNNMNINNNQFNNSMNLKNNMNFNVNRSNNNNMNIINNNQFSGKLRQNMNQFNNNININNSKAQSQKLKEKENLIKNSLKLKDPYQIQISYALGLNNNKPYEHYVAGGNQPAEFLKHSSSEKITNIDNKINVVFTGTKGNLHTRFFNKNDKIKDMLSKFMKSVGLMEYHLKNIYFLYNACNLNTINQDQTLDQVGIRNGARVAIIDLQDIIGA